MARIIGRELGKRVIDINELVTLFEAQEGEVQQIIGKTGNGKTYEGTRRALEYLYQGYAVYTTWKMDLPDEFDQRKSMAQLIWKTLFFRKRFHKIAIKENWHFLDIDRPDLVPFVATLTDCIVFLDEGQDIFDSYEGRGMKKMARQSITRTRHMRKTLIIISQRAQAVHVTARANVTFFYKCIKTRAWFWPFTPYFKIYITEEMDAGNFPIWEEMLPGGEMWQAPLWHSHFLDEKIANTYNSWYLRTNAAKSQDLHFESYDLSLKDKFIGIGVLLWEFIKSFKKEKATPPREADVAEVQTIMHAGSVNMPKKRVNKPRNLSVDNSAIGVRRLVVAYADEPQTD